MAVPKVVFTLKEVAEYLNVHPDTVRRYVKKGELPAFKIGTDWRFNKESIDRWRKAQEERCRRDLRMRRRAPQGGSQKPRKRSGEG
jgi:excisionase family DNA binding protein